jgi:hypothetical protein
VRGQVFREPAKSRCFDNGEVAPVDHLAAGFAGSLDEKMEVIAQFRGAAREVHHRRFILANPFTDPVGDASTHHFRAPGGGINVAMVARLVAFATDINLEGLHTAPAECKPVACECFFKSSHRIYEPENNQVRELISDTGVSQPSAQNANTTASRLFPFLSGLASMQHYSSVIESDSGTGPAAIASFFPSNRW